MHGPCTLNFIIICLTIKCVLTLQSNPCEFLKLEDLPTYISLLVQENGASVCNYNFSAFVLQDFDLNRGKLIVSVQLKLLSVTSMYKRIFCFSEISMSLCKDVDSN